uniref:DDE Tnp4 domain-containing protein n=1 Tax=Brassica oleracea var. oleracea TaxID=109376 RepID=A0A0D3A9C2_BRAOL
MNKPLFMRIVHRLSNEVDFFRQKKDCLGRLSLSPLQKYTAAIRLLAYGSTADTVDEYLRLGATTTRSCLEHFVERIINLFDEEYLRRPTPADLQRLLDIGEHRGFPGMIGSIDCMHWEWKNYPTAWKEFQQGEDTGGSQVDLTYSTDIPTNIANMMGVRTRIRDRQMHQQLKADLVEHLWRKSRHYQDNN